MQKESCHAELQFKLGDTLYSRESDSSGAIHSKYFQGDIVGSDASAAYEGSLGISNSSSSISEISSPLSRNIYSTRSSILELSE